MIASSAVRSVGGCSRAAAAAAVLLQQERQTIPGALSSTTSTNGIRELKKDTERNFSACALGHAAGADLSLCSRAGHVRDSIGAQLASSADQLLLDFARDEGRFSSVGRGGTGDPSALAVDTLPMPRTFEDALQPSNRAIIVTETCRPFSIVHVNRSWEELCGYSRAESLGRSLAGLLHGPATDRLAVSALMAQLLRHEEAGTVLTNYRKGGEEFRNRLRVSPLWNERGEVSHFVGVLGEAGEGA